MPNKIEELNGWSYLETLPKEESDFTISVAEIFEKFEDKIRLFSYENEKIFCGVEGWYDYKTSDYMLHCKIGFHIFHDIRFISKALSEYEEKLAKHLIPLLKELSPHFHKNDDFFVKRKNLDEWRPKNLPESVGGLKLYIQPPSYFSFINGAVVVLDYSDFEKTNQFVLYYNRMRDDFYAEKRTNGSPERISDFDCTSLDELDSLLLKLPEYLQEIDGEK